MKKTHLILSVLALMLTSLACQALADGGGADPQIDDAPVQPLPPVESTDESPALPTESSDDPGFSGETDFPMTDDATNVVSVAGTLTYQTDQSLEDVLKFYRDVYGSQGYTERELLTTVSDGVFSIVFDGHESGQAIVVQAVDLGNGSVNVTVYMQDI